MSKDKAGKKNGSSSSAGNRLRLYSIVFVTRQTKLTMIIMINKRKLLLEIVQLSFIITFFITFQADLFLFSQTLAVRP